mgnify:CR=1 FL=1
MVLGTCDAGYEGGCVWPGLPGPVMSLVHYWFERKYKGVWRFSPCSTCLHGEDEVNFSRRAALDSNKIER